MKRPLTDYTIKVAPNPHGGVLNNSFKPPEGEIKIMFWNIQNLYEHGIFSKEEYKIEEEIEYTGKKTKAETPMVIKKKNVDTHMKMKVQGNPTTHKGDKFGDEAMRREWIARVINDSGADIVVIAEPAIGTTTFFNRINNPQVLKQNLEAMKGSSKFLSVDVGGGSWGPEQIQIDLNKLFDVEGSPWCSAISAINATEIDLSVKKGEIEGKKGKNSMFEMYGLLWRKDRISVGTKELHEIIKIVNLDKGDSPINFLERAPGHIEFFSLKDSTKCFDLFCLHNLFGKGGAAEVRQKRGDGIANLTKLKNFDPEQPTVIAGDFNLDAGFHLDAAYYEPLNSKMVRRISGQKSSYTEIELVSEYDHIYTSKLGVKQPGDTVIDIAKKYFQGSYAAARKISDHMPVIATLKSEKFGPKAPPSDTVAVGFNQKMRRIKSEHLERMGLKLTDSIFLAAVRGANLARKQVRTDDAEQCLKLIFDVGRLLLNAHPDSEIARMVYQRIDDLYEDALWVDPVRKYKNPRKWIFNSDEELELEYAQRVARSVCEGYGLDESIIWEGINITDDFYYILHDLVWTALGNRDNCVFWEINPNVKLPGVGPNLQREFRKPEPLYDVCYEAYCNDLKIPGGIEGSFVEAYAICLIYACPVYIFSLDDSGKIVRKEYLPPTGEMYTKGIGRPLYFLYDGSRYDCLYE